MTGRIRGSRLTSTTNQVDRGAPLAERQTAAYWCADDHHTAVTFSADAQVPSEWSCAHCGGPASLDRGTAGASTRPPHFFRTSYEFLMMRRTPEEGELLLAEALAALREARQHGRGAIDENR